MTLEQVKAYYANIIDTEKVKLTKLKSQIFSVGTVRLIVVLVCAACIYLLWGNSLAIVLVILAAIVVFCILMKLHNILYIRRHYCEMMILNAENELKGINYDYSSFDGAEDYADGNHSFSLDLDLFGKRSIFQSLNRTVTSYGKDCLANTILSPFDTKEAIEDQQAAIRELSGKIDLLAHFRAIGQTNDTKDIDVKRLSEGLGSAKQIGKTFWRFMPYVSVASFLIVISLIVSGVPPALPISFIGIWWTIMLVVSGIPMKGIKQKINLFEKNIDTLQVYSNLFEIIEKEKFESALLQSIQKQVGEGTSASKAIHLLKSYSNNLDQSFTVLGLFFLNPILFWGIIYGAKIENWIIEYKNYISNWFTAIGRFDSLVSLGIYAYNHPDYVFPQVSNKEVFEGEELGHPLLNRDICVRNDVTMNKYPYFLVVTGANMAGKSTYLRTIGVNITLACAGSVVCAKSLKFYPYHLVTNLRTSDSLSDSESYFFAELKRLKMIIDRLQSGEKIFIILDEILKGTNSEDKQKGSIALMKQLIANNGTGIIATHDLILGNLEHEYPNEVKDYRFEADITNDQLTFTYKIREGVAQNMNACFLMKKMGITGL